MAVRDRTGNPWLDSLVLYRSRGIPTITQASRITKYLPCYVAVLSAYSVYIIFTD